MAQAILDAVDETATPASEVTAIPGLGLTGDLAGTALRMGQLGLISPDALASGVSGFGRSASPS